MKYLKSAVYKESETVHKLLKYKIVAQRLMLICFFKKERNGEGGIRTPDPVSRVAVFETAALNQLGHLSILQNKIKNKKKRLLVFYFIEIRTNFQST